MAVCKEAFGTSLEELSRGMLAGSHNQELQRRLHVMAPVPTVPDI